MHTNSERGLSGRAVTTTLLAAALAWTGAAQVTRRASVGSGGKEADGLSNFAAISADGRCVAFASAASNLTRADTNPGLDVFVHDRFAGTTELVSVDSSDVQGNDSSWHSALSTDGRYVAFDSFATNLVGGDTNQTWDVFVRDRIAGTTERVSVDSSGSQGNGRSEFASMSADGRYVAFQTDASNFVAGDVNHEPDVFVRDRIAGTTELVSIGPGGVPGDGVSWFPSISSDGRYVAFESSAPNIVIGDTNASADIFVRDRVAGATERVSVDSVGVQANGDCWWPAISADGRCVAFESDASNLVAMDSNQKWDVFVRDRLAGTIERVSVDSGRAQGDDDSFGVSLSADGRAVAFTSYASNLVGGDTNMTIDVFVRDRLAGTTERVSVATSGAQASNISFAPSISADAGCVAFASAAANLIPLDTNLDVDVFVRDRDAAHFTSLCDAGSRGVIDCPCANPPSRAGRGCDNSSATGGAVLSASGIAYLGSDRLVFTTSGEKPTALSMLMQGKASLPGGVVYGQGVRCVGGTVIRHLYVRIASGGSITVPDVGAGDPAVSVRSSAKGDEIGPGESRSYLVYYRDAAIVGGCPASSTFNSTQTGEVAWAP